MQFVSWMKKLANEERQEDGEEEESERDGESGHAACSNSVKRSSSALASCSVMAASRFFTA